MYASGGNATLDTIQISTGNRLLDYAPYSDYAMPNLKLVQVALLAEGVDRNRCFDPEKKSMAESPSSRRAWIEIQGDADDFAVIDDNDDLPF